MKNFVELRYPKSLYWPICCVRNELLPYRVVVLLAFLLHLLSFYSNYCVCEHLVDSLQTYGLQSVRLLCPWDSPDKNTGVRCHFLLQGIFPSQGLNLGLLHCRQILYCLSHQGSHMYTHRVKLFLFADDNSIYRKIPKNPQDTRASKLIHQSCRRKPTHKKQLGFKIN